MKTLTTLMALIAPATAFAASGSREDSSGLFVWIFLGFCALIVVAQLIPAVLLMFGIVKGVAAKRETEVAAEKK